MNFEELVTVDISNLEGEYVKHAYSYFLVSNKFTELSKNLASLEQTLKVRSAELAKEYKAEAKAAGGKLTAVDVENLVDSNPEIIALFNDKIDLQYKVNLVSSALKSLEHKKEMLKLLGWSVGRNEMG